MYKHILNLKKKVSPIIIEKIIIKDESVQSRILRTVFSIAVVFSIVWGVTKAEEIISEMLPQEEIEPTVSFSLAGLIKEVYSDKIVLTRAVGVDSDINVFEIDIVANEQIIETNTYEKILVADLLVGDKVIVQGLKRDGKFFSRRIISFATRFIDTEGINGVIEPEIAGEEILEIPVATTTEPLSEAIATTTDETISDAASTTEPLEIIEDATSTASESLESTDSNSDETSTTTEDVPAGGEEASSTTDSGSAPGDETGSSEPAGEVDSGPAPTESTEETISDPSSADGTVNDDEVTQTETQPATEGDNSSSESTVSSSEGEDTTSDNVSSEPSESGSGDIASE